MPATITIVTPENVEIEYELAGIGSRVLAAILDTMIHMLALTLLVYGIIAVEATGLRVPPALGPWLWAAGIIILFGGFWGYYIYFETKWSGQTPGKRAMRLRVIRDGGYPIDFRAAVTRNLMRYVDFLPTFYTIGLVSIFFSRDYKRLGDFVAGTIVIQEGRAEKRDGARGSRSDGAISSTPVAPSPAHAAPSGPDSELPPFDVSAVSRAEYRAVRQYLDRRHALAVPVRRQLLHRLEAPLRARLSWHAGDPPADPEAFLESVALWFERRHGT
jgi:uncharacterized RDD family membrane protein YckC